jgi:hypothetical protein
MKRGPKSSADLAMVKKGKIASIMDSRPIAPDQLTAEEAEHWDIIVQRLPAGNFSPEVFPVLIAYIRHSSAADLVSNEITRWEPNWRDADGGLERYEKLLKMRERETKNLVSCGRALRITNHARQPPKTAFRAAAAMSSSDDVPWKDSQFLNN